MSALNNGPGAQTSEELAVTEIKIIIIMLVFLISLLLFGRYMF